MKVFITIVMLLIMPACAMLFFRAYNRDAKKKSGILYMIAVAATALVTVLFSKVIFSGRSIYETLACVGIAAVVTAFAVALIGRQVKLSVDPVLKLLCAFSVITAVYSILTYGQARINSDTATATLLVQSQIKHGTYFPKSWNYVNGSIWTIGLAPVVAPFSVLMNNQSLARMLGSALYVLLTVAGMIFISKKLFRSNMWAIAIPLFLVFLTGENEHILYQGSNAGNMLWLSVNVTLVFLAVYRSKKYYIPYFLIMVANSAAGTRIYAEQVIPLLTALLVVEFCYRNAGSLRIEGKKVKECIINALLVILPALIGLGLYKWLCSTHNASNYAAEITGGGTVFVSLSDAMKNIPLYFSNLFHCFGFTGGVELSSVSGVKNLIAIAVCVLVCFLCPFLQWRRIKEEDDEVKFLFVYAIAHNLIILILIVFCGLTTPRYILSSLFVLVLLSTRYMYAHWLKKDTLGIIFWPGVFAAATILECIILVSAGKGWKSTVDSNKAFNSFILEKGLEKGYATYWHAYSNSIYSDLNIRYGAVEVYKGQLYEYDWLVDSETYVPEAKRTFLLLEPFEIQLTGEKLEQQFGKPEEEVQIGGLHLLIYDYDVASEFRKYGIYEPKDLLKNENVELEGDVFTINNSGCVFGPADTINCGTYKVTFEGDHLEVASCDVFSGSRGSMLTYREVERSDKRITLELTILDTIDDIEYRVFNNGFEKINLYRILLSKER